MAENSCASSVTVQAAEQQVDADVRKQHGEKADNRNPGRAPAGPSAYVPAMQERGIDEPGDERPGFLRVPRPIGAPGRVRPDGPRNDADGQEDEPERRRLGD